MPFATYLEVAAFLFAAAGVFSASGSLLASAGFVVAALASFALSWSVRCPRCELQVHSTDGVRKFGQAASKNCERCGRTRIGVWPLQYKLRPEHWDGTKASVR